MRTKIPTLLSLFEYAEIIGLNPFWLAQIRHDIPRKGQAQNITCDHVLYQDAWQGYEHLGREEIAQSIAQAERLFAKETGFYPAPKYFEDEPHPYPHNTNRRQYFPYIQARNGYIQAVGTELLTAISDEATVFSSSYGGSFNDTFTVTATVPAGTTAAEIAAFFVETDRADMALAQTEIRPLDVSIDGTTATIKGHITLLVKPALQVLPNPDELSATNTAIYASEISVYRRTTDLSDTGSLIWVKPHDCANPPCQVELETACFSVQDAEQGWLEAIPATYNAETAEFSITDPFCVQNLPNRVEINYLAGHPRQADKRMEYDCARAIALLATALLPQRTAGCSRADQRLLFYRNMPVDEDGNLETDRDLMRAAGRKFGVMGRGACEALLLMQPLLVDGVSG